MIDERTALRCILVSLLLLALALCVPATAQGTVARAVQSGETIEVGSDPLVLDLVNLRNTSTFNPVTELRHYQDDNPAKQIVRVIAVPKDDYFTINDYALGGRYGRYFAYSSKDGQIERRSIVFARAPAATGTGPTETATAAEEITATPSETLPATATATPARTQAPLPGLIAIAAVGICGLVAAAGRR